MQQKHDIAVRCLIKWTCQKGKTGDKKTDKKISTNSFKKAHNIYFHKREIEGNIIKLEYDHCPINGAVATSTFLGTIKEDRD